MGGGSEGTRKAPGLKFLRLDAAFAVFEAGSGTYEFESLR